MSENLSIEQIIERAQQIKEKAEIQLKEAEKSLDEKAKIAIDEVVVDEEAVAKRIAKAYEQAEEEEDVKEYVPSKAAPKNETDEPDDEDMIIAGEDDDIKIAGDDDDIKIAPNIETSDNGKTKVVEDKTMVANFVSTNTGAEAESGLESIPTIVSTHHVKEFNNPDDGYDEEVGFQIKFEGFDENIDDVEKIDEELAEAELERRREEKVGKFRLYGPDETDVELGDFSTVPEEYDEDNERDAFLEKLISKRSHLLIRIVTSGAILIALLIMSVFKDNPSFPLFLSSHATFFAMATGLYALSILINFNIVLRGLNLKRINFDLPIALASLSVLAHMIVMTVHSSLWIDNGVLLAPVGVFAMLMSQLGKHIMMNRLVLNFDFITNEIQKYTVENITNDVDAEIISRGMIEKENPLLKMSVKCDFPSNFLEISCKREPADKIATRIFVIDAILSIVLTVFVGITNNWNTAVNAGLSAFMMSLPVSSLIITNSLFSDISTQLSSYDCAICGYEGAAMTQDADGIVMEAADLFDKNSCDLHGIKTFGGTKVDDAIINAAAVMIHTKSPLAHVFDDVIIGKQSILPKVESVTYEEKMGTSAWIYKRKVLVGTREMLEHHGIKLPQKSFEEKYTVKDRKALYLAIDGNLSAMFVVSYSADPDLKRELKKLEKRGAVIIVKSADPYINEKSISELFALPEGFIRVMNYSAARVYDKYSNLDVEKSPAYVVHSGSALGFVAAMRGAGILISAQGMLGFLLTFGSILGFVGIAFLSVIDAYSQITAFSIIMFQIIWSVFVFIVSKLRGLGL